ncbi:hypothetical protein F5Y18DRAFT_157979 [Xylariaceae sp. FL1019]|nr:hypothetical protein F5Y18DRAFT_157979 [Xylariaceae sp. FL1019]
MTFEPRPPPTRNGSGSRPPTSRFQEGSMNDRTSAAPPAQFLGSGELMEHESQVYGDQSESQWQRRDRPYSTTAQMETVAGQRASRSSDERPRMAHKKTSGFFSRVRDALFSRGAAQAQSSEEVQGQAQTHKQQEVRRKHSSLQEPIQPPRPGYLHPARSQSEINIPQIVPQMGSSTDRPSRDDVMASYKELMATGFFQSHAIQSTRHAGPAGARQPQPPAMPTIAGSPYPPRRASSVHAPTDYEPPSPAMTSPKPQQPRARSSRDFARPARPPLTAAPSVPELRERGSRYALRGRKRTRDVDDTPLASPADPQASTTSNSTSTGYFAQPLKRVAKKLRKMPSSTTPSVDNTAASSLETQAPAPTGQVAPDGIIRLVPSLSSGGTLYQDSRAVRLRSPSPAPAELLTSDRDAHRKPRRTFSGSLRGRSNANRLAKRASATPVQTTSYVEPRSSTQKQNALGQWQRVSLEDTLTRPDMRSSNESPRRSNEGPRRAREIRNVKEVQKTLPPPILKVVPDANTGIPSVPLIPERWHGTGQAYHLRDRGQSVEIARGAGVRRQGLGNGVDSIRGVNTSGANVGRKGDRYGKENKAMARDGDGDGDVDMESWRIGSAV